MKFASDSVLAYSVKVAFNGELRRFTYEGFSFNDLVARVVEIFGLAQKDSDIVVQYKDDEGDHIKMSSDAELREAVAISPNILHLNISLNNNANNNNNATVGVVAAAPNPPQPNVMPPCFADKESIKQYKCEWKMHKHMKREEWKQWKAAWKGQRKGGCRERNEGKLVARHVKDVTVEDGTEVPPNTPFVKTWRVRNEGPAWPAGCRLLFISRNGDNLGGPEFVPVPGDGPIQPGQEVDISVSLVSPAAPGRYIGFWKLCTPEGRKFGQRLWVSVVVPSTSSSDETPAAEGGYEDLANTIADMGFTVKKKFLIRMLHKHGGDVDKVVNILTKRCKGLKQEKVVNA